MRYSPLPASGTPLMRTAVFSIVSPNYRHYARVLMASVQREHPEWERFVLLVGGDAGEVEERGFTTVPLSALNLPDAPAFCFRYTILELNTAVKPWMFAHLFGRGFDRVIYFDPDIALFSRLEELDTLGRSAFLTLTPHLTGSIGDRDAHPSERTILQAGTYNLGFLAVSRHPELDRFLSWWQQKLEFQCVVDLDRGLFVDQKWMDLTPGLFPDVTILRHDGYNVAYWNLAQRHVVAGATGEGADATASGVMVNGQPLRFFHFSGVEPASSQLVSKHDSTLRLAEAGDVRALVEAYAESVRDAGYESFRNAPYAFATFNDGSPLPNAARLLYRNSPQLQAAAGSDPFQHPELFRGVRDEKRGETAAKVALHSYRLLSRARPIVRLLPKPMRTAMREFLLGRRESRQPHVPSSALPPGINVAGYVTRESGVGESARLFMKSCEAAGIATHAIDIDGNDPLAQQAVHRTNVFHVNADQTPAVHAEFGSLFDAGTCNIGVWHWELPELPDGWISSAAPLDEIWAPSAFIQSAISRKITIPIVHMPHGVSVDAIEPCAPQELGVPPGRFTFLCMFDLGSVTERKNPLGAVEAFRRAFAGDDRVALLIKAGRADAHRDDYAELQARVRDIPNVYLTSEMLPRARVNGLIAACDAVISLHRSEGFGLILAEAMALGRPVIATAWSGNMDFMTTSNSCLVGYELVTLTKTHGAYPEGEQWAEPDLDHAADWMTRLLADESLRRRIGERGRETIRTRFSPEAAGLRYRRRLTFLGLMEPWP
jgi:glycosyltransferase involved in cell wall biosynthesis